MPPAAPSKPLLRVLAGEAGEPPPLWLMRQAGRYLPEYRAVRAQVGSFLDLCFTPEAAAEVTLQPVRRFGLDAAILFSDILVVPHAMGQPLAFHEQGGPVLAPVRSLEEVERLRVEGAEERLRPVFETVERVAAALPADVALIGFAGAPWTVATYMVEGRGATDFAIVKAMASEDSVTFARLIDRLVAVTGDYLVAQIDHGAEVLQLFDSWAGVLPEAQFRRWVIAPTRALVQRVRKAHPRVPIIGFPRAAGDLYRAYQEETGVDCVSLDQAVAPGWAASQLAPRGVIQGNLDPALLVAGGAAMEEGVDTILSAWRGLRFIFNLGHGILPATPPDHVQQLVARVRGPR